MFLYTCPEWNVHNPWRDHAILRIPICSQKFKWGGGVQRQRHGMSECMPFGQLNQVNRKLNTEVWLKEKCQPGDVGFNFGSTEASAGLTGKHSGPPFLLSETRVLQGERASMTGHLVCQQHGSSRNVTLKSSCGHSMVPTARAYAGLCQEIQTALSVAEPWACLHKRLRSVRIRNW